MYLFGAAGQLMFQPTDPLLCRELMICGAGWGDRPEPGRWL